MFPRRDSGPNECPVAQHRVCVEGRAVRVSLTPPPFGDRRLAGVVIGRRQRRTARASPQPRQCLGAQARMGVEIVAVFGDGAWG